MGELHFAKSREHCRLVLQTRHVLQRARAPATAAGERPVSPYLLAKEAVPSVHTCRAWFIAERYTTFSRMTGSFVPPWTMPTTSDRIFTTSPPDHPCDACAVTWKVATVLVDTTPLLTAGFTRSTWAEKKEQVKKIKPTKA